jgi:hypothetical protein
MSDHDGGILIEEFIQALTSQLDRAQSTLAVKARNGLPLTFAVKDITLDLRANLEVHAGAVHIYPAGPADKEASVLHLSLTTITRPMIEENTLHVAAELDEPSLREVLGDTMTEEEQRRLEWAGIHTATQLRDLERQGGENAVERVSSIPALRLRQALERASQPLIRRVTAPEHGLLRVHGINLMKDQPPDVRIGGEPVAVVEASEKQLVLAPLAHQLGGVLELETTPGSRAEFSLTSNPAAPKTAGEAV